MIKMYKEYSQSYKYDKEEYSHSYKYDKNDKRYKNGYSIKIGIKTETCQKSINDI
jgi:hypothetical protein